jgi:RHS repeat-associated protein
VKFNVPDPTIPNATQFDREKSIHLDKVDNIMSIVENYNGQSQTITTDIPEDTSFSKLNQYAYFDQWGLSYDLNGNTTQKGTQHFSYDYRNQLVIATDINTTVEMKYDVFGRRIQETVTIGTQSKTRNFYYSGNQLIEERDGNDNITRQYIYGNGIDEIIRMDVYDGGTVSSYYFHTDAIGSVTAITDENGNIVERYTYDIYGMPTFWDASGNVIAESSIGNNILFQGREYSTELNLYYFRARYYCPIMGRFVSVDPMGYKDSMNMYQAFNQNPVNFVDPMGELIYLTGEDPKSDFEIFKNIFVQMGISREELNKTIKLKQDEEGRYYIDRSSYIPFTKRGDLYDMKRQIISKWRENFTTNLKGTKRFNMSLEFIFSWIIQHPFPIEFSVDKYAFWGDQKKKTERSRFKDTDYGRGVFLQPDEDLNINSGKAIQIVVDPNPKISLKGGEYHVAILGHKQPPRLHASQIPSIPLTLETAIVHEFGHAYAFLKGHKVDPDSHTSLNAEIAVLLENLYRLRTYLIKYGLRKYH